MMFSNKQSKHVLGIRVGGNLMVLGLLTMRVILMVCLFYAKSLTVTQYWHILMVYISPCYSSFFLKQNTNKNLYQKWCKYKRIQSCSLMWSLKMVYHFFKTIFSHRVPVCAAINFFKSPMVSSGLHLTLTFFPNLSLHVTSNIC